MRTETSVSSRKSFLIFLFQLLLASSVNAQQIDAEVLNGTFLGNWERNYYGNEAPDTLEIIWKHYLGEGETVISRKSGKRLWKGAGWTGQPLMVREDSNTFLIQGAYDHHLKKINAANGELVWQYDFEDVIKGTGTLWQKDKNDPSTWLILQGSRLGAMPDHFLDAEKVYSFRAVSYTDGKEVWRHNVKLTRSYSRDVDASAIVHNDTAYIGLENSLFTLFYPDPDSAYDNTPYKHPLLIDQHFLHWKSDVAVHGGNLVTEASPALQDRRIIIASGSGHVWAYDMNKEKIDWDFFIGSDIDGSPVVTSDGCVLISVEKQYIKGKGGLLKLDPSKSPEEAVVWYLPVGDTTFASWQGGIIGTAAISDRYNDRSLGACMAIDGYLYFFRHDTLSDQKVKGFDAETEYPTPVVTDRYYVGPSISSPLFLNKRIVACSYNGIHLFSYDENGRLKLLDKLPYVVESTPFVYNKRIYIASRNGYMYCLGRKE